MITEGNSDLQKEQKSPKMLSIQINTKEVYFIFTFLQKLTYSLKQK